MKTYKDYYTGHMAIFEPFDCRGYTSIRVLEFLNGKRWDDVALAYVHTLRPTSIRVAKDGVTLDACLWRITVFIDNQDIIKYISQEVEVGLPDGVAHGQALEHALKYGIDSEQVKWHRDCSSYEYICNEDGKNCGFFKYTKDGKRVKFPELNE